MLLRDRRGYSMTFWAVFIGLVMIPALALAIELGRYFYAISEVAKAADAAAVAASAEINQQVLRYRKSCSHFKNLGERSGLCDFKYSQLIRKRGACLCYRNSSQWGRQHGTGLCVSRFIYPVSISSSQGAGNSNRDCETASFDTLINLLA